VHVEHPSGSLVILLDETTRKARLREKSRNVTARDARTALRIVDAHFDVLLVAWERIHRGKE